MDFALRVLANLVFLIAGIWFFFKARRWAKEVHGLPLKWSRRFALLFLFAPLLSLLGGWIFNPPISSVFETLGAVADWLDAAIGALSGETERSFGFWWALCVRPLLVAVIYMAAGFAVGWPLDLLARKKAKEAADDADDSPAQG